DLPTGASKGRWLIEEIARLYAELGGAVCAERTIAHAIECAERRVAAHDDARAVLVHGDVHRWNTLRTLDGASWKLVDPDGLLAAPEYDLAILMREDPTESDGPEARADWLAARTGCDRDAIWEWGVVERVSTGLVASQIGLQPEASHMLALADRIAATAS
ncbi:MAG TPA: phosphotransferase, partial [Acidimicrobiales bacterium]|nr:phosphotransferase [Acidimicrobiales bacterium]